MSSAVAAALVLTGCGGDTPDAAPATTATQTPSAAETIKATATTSNLDTAFRSANSAAPWIGSVSGVVLDGKAVLVRTTLGKKETANVVPMCEAARKAADQAGTDYVSVTVRSAQDSSIGTWNKLRGDTACSVA